MGGLEQTVTAAPPDGTPPEIWLVVVVVSAAFGFAIQLVRAFLQERSKTRNGSGSGPGVRTEPVSTEVIRLIEDLHHDRDGVPRWTVTKNIEDALGNLTEAQHKTNTKLDTLIDLEKKQNDLLRQVIHGRSGEHAFIDDDDEG